MSGKSSRQPKKSNVARKTDARVRRTHAVLGGALVNLMHEKPFDSITVQDVLDRAGVSRSTFYTHFSDKDDLFFSDAEEFFTMMAGALTARGDTSDRVAPVHELFAHVAEMQQFRAALAAAGKTQDILELAIGIFARGIDARLAGMPRARNIQAGHRAAMAHALAGALFSLLTWWLNRGAPEPPEQMDKTFHRMVWAGVNSAPATTAPKAARR